MGKHLLRIYPNMEKFVSGTISLAVIPYRFAKYLTRRYALGKAGLGKYLPC